MSARARSRLGPLAAAAAAVVVALAAAPTAPAAVTPADRLFDAEQYLANAITPTGDFQNSATSIPEGRATLAWGALGLAAAGINVNRQRNAGATVYEALNRARPLLGTTSDRALYLLVEATIRDLAHDDGTGDATIQGLVDDILPTRVATGDDEGGGFTDQGTGGPPGVARPTALAALGLWAVRPVREVQLSATAAALSAVDWLLRHQHDGYWTAIDGVTPDTETSALAIEAIMAVGLHDVRSHDAATAFGGWLRTIQNPDGGFSAGVAGNPSDLSATAAAVQGLVATQTSVADYNPAGQTPLDLLATTQGPAAHYTQTGDRIRLAGHVALAFSQTPLPLGYVTGTYGVSSSAPQTPPKGLPTGPTLPVEIAAPPVTPAPAAPAPPATSAPAPTIQAPAAAPTTAPSGVRRIANHKRTKPADAGGDGDTGLAGGGTGSGGGGGTVATAGAPDRAGGGGGTGTSVTSVPAAVAGTPLPTDAPRRHGGTPVKSDNDAERQVRGTVIGRDSATPGAKGSRTAAPGAAGSAAGHGSTPWWAIVLALLVAGGVVGGATLDRRRPELAL
ncbi:MAG TPA: hypothetical protein VFG42_14845 [Baekduia sp.]|uniref:hypothetical protein n=1 Tax=Baekduia sp. TaxID=2600305 RepID=UPI002D7A189F|nr:hypothetical protein [Baekduia sp.]HET6508066.1 hypothetical protein [Baekduia sp.]